jgi:hypothetical protein
MLPRQRAAGQLQSGANAEFARRGRVYCTIQAYSASTDP